MLDTGFAYAIHDPMNEFTANLFVRVPDGWPERLKEIAAARMLNQSDVVREALANYMAKYGASKRAEVLAQATQTQQETA